MVLWIPLAPVSSFGYAAFTLIACFPKTVLLDSRSLSAVRTPARTRAGLGFSHFARRYFGNRVFFLFLRVLRCFSSPGSLPVAMYLPRDAISGGFPHSEISGSLAICASPKLFAACRVLHRLLVPRHPPCALCSLIFVQAGIDGFAAFRTLACGKVRGAGASARRASAKRLCRELIPACAKIGLSVPFFLLLVPFIVFCCFQQ